MTAFRHEQYVADALDGILMQETDFDFDVLVGDDCSPDGTRAVISRYVKQHPGRVQAYFPDQNLGGGGKVIFAELIKQSRGEYIAFLDADDYWTAPDKLQKQVNYLDEHPEVAMCFHDVICRYDDGSPDARYNDWAEPGELDYDTLLAYCPVASCSPVLRRETIDSLPDWYFDLPWGDWPLYFLATRFGIIWYMPEQMGVYRIHAGGMYTGLPRLQALETDTKFYEQLEGIVPPEHERSRQQALARVWTGRGIEHELRGERADARRCLRESLRVWPFRRPVRWLPPHWGTGEQERIRLWLRLNGPVAPLRKLGRPRRGRNEAQGFGRERR